MQVRVAQDDMGKAQEAAEEAVAIWTKSGDKIKAGAASQVVANIRIAKLEFKEMLQQAKKSLEVCREQGDDCGEAQQLLTIANVRVEQARSACPTLQAIYENGTKALSMKRLMEALMSAKEAC